MKSISDLVITILGGKLVDHTPVSRVPCVRGVARLLVEWPILASVSRPGASNSVAGVLVRPRSTTALTPNIVTEFSRAFVQNVIRGLSEVTDAKVAVDSQALQINQGRLVTAHLGKILLQY